MVIKSNVITNDQTLVFTVTAQSNGAAIDGCHINWARNVSGGRHRQTSEIDRRGAGTAHPILETLARLVTRCEFVRYRAGVEQHIQINRSAFILLLTQQGFQARGIDTGDLLVVGAVSGDGIAGAFRPTGSPVIDVCRTQ